jgi:hypothetical protein
MGVYSSIASRTMQRRRHTDIGYIDPAEVTDLTCVPQMTLFSSVFASPSRVQLAHESGMDCSSTSYQYAAGRNASVATLKVAHDLGMEYSAVTMLGAAERSGLPVLQFLHAQGCPWDETVSKAAAERGAFKKLRWLREHGCDWNSEFILFDAATTGDLQMTAWVKQQPGVELNFAAMEAAAAFGHTAICAYLHAEQCPWDSGSTANAAGGGHVDTLRWLHEHGCRWDVDEIRIAAAESGSVDVLAYLQQHNDVDLSATALTDILNAAGAKRKLVAVQWLREQGAEWPIVLQHWSDDMVVWARAQGCTSPTE